MKNNNTPAQSGGRFRLKTLNGALLCALATWGNAQAAPYVENGRAGDPASWRSAEFQADWGLGAIGADYAYAAGYSGKGVKLGIFDQPVYAAHPEFSGANKVVTLVTRGIREYTDPYIPVKAGDAFVYDGSPSVGSNGKLGAHGTHVGGIAAGSRDGGVMHGVAFGAQIISADNGDPGPEDGIVRGNDGAVYKAGWDALIASGARIINNSWGIGITDRFDLGGRDPAYPHFTVNDAQLQFNEIRQLMGTKPGGAYDGAIAAARSGIVTIFAAGNDYNLNNPDAIAGLGYFVPDIAPNWMTVAALQKNPNQGSPIPYTLSTFSSRCGYTASFCVSAPGTRIYSSIIEGTNADNLTTGYANYNGTSMAAPHAAGSVAVLMERFPYMTGAEVASVLRTTATDLGAPGIDALYGWGMINLRKAIDGPAMFVTAQDIPAEFRVDGAYGNGQFVADLPGIGAVLDAGKPSQRLCTDITCGLDVWRNDISGHGGLTKQGLGTLVLAGANTYAGPTLVNQGRLAINGSLTSAVTVNDSGILGGNGRIGALSVKRGGTVAPGNSIGTLNVAGDVTFEPGSTYAVEVSPTSSDQIVASGKAIIDGATVSLSLENSPTLLTSAQVKSLLGTRYDILQAAGGIEGRFGQVLPNYAFLGGILDYSTGGIGLTVARNGASFASVGATPNQRAVGAAAEALGAGNALYETLLLSATPADAQQAFQQLTGEIHPAIGTLLINDSRHLRDAVGERLRERDMFDAGAPTDDRSNAWFKVLGAWGKSDGGHDYADSTSSIGGLLLGVDGLIADNTRLGFVTGYSDSSLSMGEGTHSSAKVDSYHLGAYLGHQMDAWRLTVGGAYGWHRIDVKRDLAFGDVSGKQKVKRDATTAQLFTEAAYDLGLKPMNLEPFVNLAYVHLNSDSFTEKGDAAALKGGEDNRDAVLSTLGVRAKRTFALTDKQQLELGASLGWQHNLSGVDSKEHLAFANGNSAFTVQSVSMDRDAAVVGVRAGLAVGSAARVSLDYNGLIGEREKDHGVGLTLDWAF